MGKWVDHVLISVKNYGYLVVELALVIKNLWIEDLFGKNRACFKPYNLLAKPFYNVTILCVTWSGLYRNVDGKGDLIVIMSAGS